MPDQFLSRYQLNRIDTDNYGAIIDLDHNQLKMVSGIYIYARIMIMNILMTIANQHIADTEGGVNAVIQNNIKIVSSILYYLLMQVINKMMESYERDGDTPNNDIFSSKLLPFKDIKVFFLSTETNKQFCESMKSMIWDWMERLASLVKNAEEIRERMEDQIA